MCHPRFAKRFRLSRIMSVRLERRPQMMRPTSILSEIDVRRWYENLREDSTRTAEEYLRWLNDYCTNCSLTPLELIKDFERDKKAAEDCLEDYIRSLKTRKSRVDG